MTNNREILSTLDPATFFGALLLAPLAVALVFFWLLLIPVFAIYFGALPYLVFGTPVLLWMVTRFPISLGNYAIGGLAAHSLFVLCLSTVANSLPPSGDTNLMAFIALWGIPFAPIWFMAFALIYRHFYRPIAR